MKKPGSRSTPHWRATLFTGMLVGALTAGIVPVVRAFKIGTPSEPPIHENLTSAAMFAVMPNADPMFVMNIQSGVFNTDLSHQPIAAFHFDDSTVTNGGFDAGFHAIYGPCDQSGCGMLTVARSEAVICNTSSCYVNPLFLNPQHASFRDLAEDIVGTYNSLVWNGGCWNEPACPTEDFATSAAWLQTEMLPILLDTDPDPDEVTAYTPLGFSFTVPNFADDLAQAKSTLDALLGPRCRSDGSICFDTLEQMATDDNDFQLLAGHLRILQYEYQAYYAWQHLGHAFHTSQDFFAHSNYTELASGRKGPQCDSSAAQATTLCDAPLDSGSGPYTAIRLPTDGAGFISSLASLQTVFGAQSLQGLLNSLPSIFGDANYNHLQTGYFPCSGDFPTFGTPGPGLSYCHTASSGSAGLNKDKEYASGSELNHLNFQWAQVSAQRMSVVVFEAFISDLLGPATGSYVSATSAGAASQRVGEMAWLSRSGPTVIASGNTLSITRTGLPTTTLTGPQLQQLTTQLPTLSAVVSSSGPSATPVTDVVTVTSNGLPMAGATVSVGNSTYITSTSGVAVITHAACFAGTQVAKVGAITVPARVPVPCSFAARASKAGYQSFSFTLP